jgi:hypothetical protein
LNGPYGTGVKQWEILVAMPTTNLLLLLLGGLNYCGRKVTEKLNERP